MPALWRPQGGHHVHPSSPYPPSGGFSDLGGAVRHAARHLAEQQAFRQLGLVEADRRTRDLPAGFPCDGCQTATVAQPGFCARCTAPITRKDAGTGRAFAGLVLVFMVSGSFDQYKTLAAAPLSLWLLLGLSVLLMVWGRSAPATAPPWPG
ncbi:hypothetical protein [Deinococcus multiflagellatus]|uniref:Uncharacterized protein n=1 Tax=Deinococcus multiflagellatus TaxID=1656887 RepID=A0ABW1ZQM8_9DEIO